MWYHGRLGILNLLGRQLISLIHTTHSYRTETNF